ncbi:hypothetical protein FRC06_009515 [Ceratobasidium sp. 370]|nr:hypothetical protein FRC06_009515 [Ceratobasidium sp. 370]
MLSRKDYKNSIRPTVNLDRLLPYAQEHDRLQLALLYLEHEESELGNVNSDLERLNKRQGQLKDCLPIIEGEIAKLRARDDDGREEQRDALLGWFIREDQRARKELELIEERISKKSATRDQAQERLSHRPRIQGLIEELYSSAFTGETPEFPHEDVVEALAWGAKQKYEQCSRACFAGIGMPFMMIPTYLIMVHQALVQLYEFVRSPNSYNPENLPDMDQSARNTLLEGYCESFLEFYSILAAEFEEHRNKQPNCSLPAINWVEDPEEFLRTMRAATLTPRTVFHLGINARADARIFTGEQQEASDVVLNIYGRLNQFWLSIKGAQKADQEHHRKALKDFDIAGKILEFRHKQLAETRCQILDHVIDPSNCPLRSITLLPFDCLRSHMLPGSSISHSHKTGSGDEWLKQATRARLERARCTISPPMLISERRALPGW